MEANLVRAVVLDGGGVLTNGVPSGALKVLAARYPPEKQSKIASAFHDNPGPWAKIKTDPTYTEFEYWKAITADLDIEETPEQLGQILRDTFVVLEDVLQIAKEAKEKGLAIGVLSNHGSDWFRHVEEKYKLAEIFPKDLIIVSQDVGADKPSPAIFEVLLQRLRKHLGEDMVNEQVLFVDDKESNLLAARAFGIRTLHYNNRKQHPTVLRSMLAQEGVPIKPYLHDS